MIVFSLHTKYEQVHIFFVYVDENNSHHGKLCVDVKEESPDSCNHASFLFIFACSWFECIYLKYIKVVRET